MNHDDVVPAPGYPESIGLLLASLDDSTREWRSYLGNPSIEAITWQPFPGGHSVGATILHIAETEIWWIENVVAGLPEHEEDAVRFMSQEIKQGAVQWPVPPAEPIEFYDQIVRDVRARTYEAMKLCGDPDRKIELQGGTMTPRWVLGHVLQHDSYHGGQAVLLNLLFENRFRT